MKDRNELEKLDKIYEKRASFLFVFILICNLFAVTLFYPYCHFFVVLILIGGVLHLHNSYKWIKNMSEEDRTFAENEKDRRKTVFLADFKFKK